MLKLSILFGILAVMAFVLLGPLPNLTPSNLIRPSATPTPVPLSTWLSPTLPSVDDRLDFRGRPLAISKAANGWRIDFRAEGFDHTGQKTAAIAHLYWPGDPRNDAAIGQCLHVLGIAGGQEPSGEVIVQLLDFQPLDTNACS